MIVCVSLYVSVPCARARALVCVCVRACACVRVYVWVCVRACVHMCDCVFLCLCVVLGGFEQIVAAMLKEMQMCASSAIKLEQQMQQVYFHIHRFLFIRLFSRIFKQQMQQVSFDSSLFTYTWFSFHIYIGLFSHIHGALFCIMRASSAVTPEQQMQQVSFHISLYRVQFPYTSFSFVRFLCPQPHSSYRCSRSSFLFVGFFYRSLLYVYTYREASFHKS